MKIPLFQGKRAALAEWRRRGDFFTNSAPHASLPDEFGVKEVTWPIPSHRSTAECPFARSTSLSASSLAALHPRKSRARLLGRPLPQVPADAYKAQLLRYGASEDFAQRPVDMLAAKVEGLDLGEPCTPENTTATSFRERYSTVSKPAVG